VKGREKGREEKESTKVGGKVGKEEEEGYPRRVKLVHVICIFLVSKVWNKVLVLQETKSQLYKL
jgi:hypothetical protein